MHGLQPRELVAEAVKAPASPEETPVNNGVLSATAALVLVAGFAVCCAAAPALAADPTQDPGGWRQFKWGMSPQQVQSIAGGSFQLRNTGGELGELTVDGYTIGSTAVVIEFDFKCGAGLYSISIGQKFLARSDDNFAQMVEQQYGPPDNYLGGSPTWKFPTTWIDVGKRDSDNTQAIGYNRVPSPPAGDCPRINNGL